MHLFTERDERGAFVECSFPGYRPVRLTRWTGDADSITHPDVRFELAIDLETATVIKGCYIQDAEGVVTDVEEFDRPRRWGLAGDGMDLAIEMR